MRGRNGRGIELGERVDGSGRTAYLQRYVLAHEWLGSDRFSSCLGRRVEGAAGLVHPEAASSAGSLLITSSERRRQMSWRIEDNAARGLESLRVTFPGSEALSVLYIPAALT